MSEVKGLRRPTQSKALGQSDWESTAVPTLFLLTFRVPDSHTEVHWFNTTFVLTPGSQTWFYPSSQANLKELGEILSSRNQVYLGFCCFSLSGTLPLILVIKKKSFFPLGTLFHSVQLKLILSHTGVGLWPWPTEAYIPLVTGHGSGKAVTQLGQPEVLPGPLLWSFWMKKLAFSFFLLCIPIHLEPAVTVTNFAMVRSEPVWKWS